MFDLFRKWTDLRSGGGSLLDVVERFLREEEHLAPARDVDGSAVRARITLDGVGFSLVVAVQGSVVLCMCIASEPTPDDARDRVSRYLTRANVVQQLACLAMSSDGRLFARTAIDTEGIPVTKRSLTQLVNACQLLAVMFLPIGHRVARGELEPDAAAEQSESDWQAFVTAQRTP